MAENGKRDYQLTTEGVEKLKQELDFLRNVERPRVVEDIKEARAQGDLSENADYDAARDEQARVEARIKEIESILKSYVLIQEVDSDVVTMGKKVEIEFLDTKDVETYHIVGRLEADPLKNKISNESPIGSALIDNAEGDVISIKTNTGKDFKVKILKIK